MAQPSPCSALAFPNIAVYRDSHCDVEGRALTPRPEGYHAFFSQFTGLLFSHLIYRVRSEKRRGLRLSGHRLSEQWGGCPSVGPGLACAAYAESSFLQIQPLPDGFSVPESSVGCL